MKNHLFIIMAAACSSLAAATVDSVSFTQDWPWSTDIKITYELSGVTDPVDISVEAFDGETSLSIATPSALRGEVCGVAADGSHVIFLDPVKAFGRSRRAYSSFKVRVTASASPTNIDETLYKIFDLSNGSCTDVTRKDLLNGKWGDIETSYSRIDPNFTTDESDILIWTGVTNDVAYKTTHLVMRKIPAKNVVWQSGDPSGVTYESRDPFARYWVKLTYDYYMAVFETTQAQYRKIVGSWYGTTCEFTEDEDSPAYPVNGTGRYNILGHPTDSSANAKGVVTGEQIIFPHNTYVRDVAKNSFCAMMWTKTGYEFNMPTGAEWEFACRGGNDTALYSGEPQSLQNVSKLAWHSGVSGNSPTVVGSLAPNAYGLYDMLGNVFEQTSMSGNLDQGGESGSGTSSDDPVVNPLGNPNSTKDTSYTSAGTSFYHKGDTWEYYGSWKDCRSAVRCSNFNWYGTLKYVGFRFVMPARADGQWANHPGQ